MTESRKLKLAVVTTSLIASAYVLFAQTAKISAMWLPFLSWTAYCLDGLKKYKLLKTLLGLIGGMLAGATTLTSTTPVTAILGPIITLPVIVFCISGLILSLELIKQAELIPYFFLTYAGFFAYYAGNFAPENFSPYEAMPGFLTLVVLGIALGIISTFLRDNILKNHS